MHLSRALSLPFFLHAHGFAFFAASYTFRVVRLYKYADTTLGKLQLTGEIVICAFVLFYLVQEVYEVWKHGCIAYWTNGWNVIDLINLLLFVVVIGLRVALFVELSDLGVDPTQVRYAAMWMRRWRLWLCWPQTTRFYNFQPLSLLNSSEQNILAVNAFILWFKVFKYTKFLPGMDVIAETGTQSLLALLFLLFVGWL